MASQWGTIREYTSQYEAETKPLVECPLCHVKAVPRGLTSTRYASAAHDSGQTCPNCGKVVDRTWLKLT